MAQLLFQCAYGQLFMFIVFSFSTTVISTISEKDSEHSNRLLRLEVRRYKAVASNSKQRQIVSQPTQMPVSNSNNTPMPTMSFKTKYEQRRHQKRTNSSLLNHTHNPFEKSPPFPYCEYCFENGMFTLRDRDGWKVFDTNKDDNTSPFSTTALSHQNKPNKFPKWCKDTVIVQGDTRRPSQWVLSSDLKFPIYDYLYVAEAVMNNGLQTIIDAVFMINSAYAYLHGYGYLFLKINGTTSNSAGWAKVGILQYVATVCPHATVLFLDSDAYIRSINSEINYNTSFHSKQHKDRPKQYSSLSMDTFEIAMPIECQWMSWVNTQSLLKGRCLSMNTHNRVFQTGEWNPEAHAGVLNTGMIFLANAGRALPLLIKWWNFPRRHKSRTVNRYVGVWPFEQQSLAFLLRADIALRKQFLMLDPSYYSGPDGIFVRHLYGKVNKIHGARQDSDLHWTLCFTARAIQSLLSESDGWIQHRVVETYSQSLMVRHCVAIIILY